MDRELMAIVVIGGLAFVWATSGILLYAYGDRVMQWRANRKKRA